MKFRITTLMLAVLSLAGCKTAQKSAATENLPLVGTQWELTAIYGEAFEGTPSTTPFIVFQEDGKYNGSLGCNSFFGDYYQKKQTLKLQYAGSTKKLCPDMTTEDAFSKAMRQDINTFSVQGKTLRLYAGKVEILQFEAK